MKNRSSSFLAIGVLYTVVAGLFVPAEVDAQSPPQGPPTATSNAKSVLSNNLTSALSNAIQPAIAAENAKLATNPNFRAVIAATPIVSFSSMVATTNLYQPNQYFANVPFSMIYYVTNVSVLVNGAWVPYTPISVIGQDVNVQATCQGWFTGQGTLTYAVVPSTAAYVGSTNFPNPEVGTLLQQTIPNFINTTEKAAFDTYGTGSSATLVDNGANCRSLTTPQVILVREAQATSQPQDTGSPSIFFDSPVFTPPITTQQNTVTVQVKSITRLAVHGVDGLPIYAAVEAPILDFYAGFTHLHIEPPTMTEGQTFVPTHDNVATTLVPVETGTLVVLGVMTYEGLAHQDPAFLTFSKNVDYGAGQQTLDTPKQVLVRGLLASSLAPGQEPAYAVTLEITAPPVQIGSVQ